MSALTLGEEMSNRKRARFGSNTSEEDLTSVKYLLNDHMIAIIG